MFLVRGSFSPYFPLFSYPKMNENYNGSLPLLLLLYYNTFAKNHSWENIVNPLRYTFYWTSFIIGFFYLILFVKNTHTHKHARMSMHLFYPIIVE